MEKATPPFTNDQYEILKKQFIADTLGQIQIVLDDCPENEPLEKMNENFKEYLKSVRAMAIDMETATIFTVGFANEIPVGALLLVSDQPMTPEGVKTEKSDQKVTDDFVSDHLKIGIDSLKELQNTGISVKHLKF